MSQFDFVFSFFGLLLGFTLVEVLSGLAGSAKQVRTHHREASVSVRLGWLTPLLALFVLLDVTSYWKDVWSIRASVTADLDFLFGGLFIAGAYYFAASMVFPDDFEEWPDLDSWFWSHRRQALAPLFIANSCWMTYVVAMRTPPHQWLSAISFQMLYFAPLVLAMISRRSAVVAGALTFLCGGYLLFGITSAASAIG